MKRGRPAQALVLLTFILAFQFALYDPPCELHSVIHVVPTWLAVLGLATSIRRSMLSDTSFLLVILFLLLHVVGTRYVYSNVPYREWLGTLPCLPSDTWIQSERNHYDRFVHFAYGFLLTPAVAELWRGYVHVSRWWSYVEAWLFVAATSALFEWMEYCGAMALAGDDALEYLGQQGDLWDAQQDMGWAMLGAVIAAGLSQVAVALQSSPHSFNGELAAD